MAGKVMVGCKHPHGLHLDVYDKAGVLTRVTVAGNAHVAGVPSAAVGGYGLTEVDADHWKAWHEKYKDSSLVKDGIVFAGASVAAATKQAEEQGQDVKDLNPQLDPDKAPPGVEKFAKDDEKE